MEKVVKCGNKQCGLHFGYSEKKTKCPFCKTEYVETVGEKVEEKKEEKTKEKKEVAKTRKESFKIWKGN